MSDKDIRRALMIARAALRTATTIRPVHLASGGATDADPMTPVHELSPIPREQAEPIMQANADRGLQFDTAQSANRLRMKLQRHKKADEKGEDLPGMPGNPRTVLKAPEDKPQLPDFVTGRITPQDWVNRHEKLLAPHEIHDAADWYDRILGNFSQHYPNDPAAARKHMRAWLVAQQNVDVTGARNNALRQHEQINRGVPEEKMQAMGMPNPTMAARSVYQQKPVTGVGQKIGDFVDAAEGKDVRSWMGNHPAGGSPFVVDVHTARDTGHVDPILLNHLKKLGYNPEEIAKLKVDMQGTPSEIQYENRSHFGHQLTDHLNKIKWQGRSDWTPRQVQAVGWMGMTKFTADQADDVRSAMDQTTRNLSMELAPGEGSPWQKKFGKQFEQLTPQQQYDTTHHLTQHAIGHASKLAGIDVRDIVHGTGGWQKYQNPSTVAHTMATKHGAEIAAHALGHMLHQTEVWSNSIKPVTANPKGFAVDFLGEGNHNLHTDEGLRDFWGKIMDADPLKNTPKALFQGYQPIRTPDGKVGIRALIDRGGKGTAKALQDAVDGPISQMIEKLPFDVHSSMHEADILKARNDWTKDTHGQAYKARLEQLTGRDPTAHLDRAGKELEEEFRKKLQEHGQKVARATGGAVNHAPTEAQKEAGNYRKKHISFQGLPITIENEKGSIRKGKSASGHQWRCVLPCDYGYLKGTVGADRDHVDCYVGPDKDSNVVFVVNRHTPGKGFDEHKVLLGFKTEEDALCCYVAAFSDGSGPKRIGSVATMSLDGFKSWLGLQRQKAYGLRKGGIVDRALRLTASKR